MSTAISFKFYFIIYSNEEYDINKITDELNIKPTKTWIKNEKARENLYRQESSWHLMSDEIFAFIFEDPFLIFMKEIEDRIPSIQKIVSRDNLVCKINVVVQIYSGSTMPGINLSALTIKLLSSIGASIDFDLYDLRSAIQ